MPLNIFSLLNINLVSEYSLWYIFLCLFIGVLYSSVLYYKENQLLDIALWLKRTLAAIRFVLVAVIAFLLLNPLFKTVFRELEKPVIIIGQDDSESIVLGKDSSYYKNQYKSDFNQFVEKLSDKYEVRKYTFGDKVNTNFAFDFKSKETDISSFINEINTRYANRNVGAVILASDGLYNKGLNPLYAPLQLKAPVYSVLLGDTALKRDLILSKVNHNRIAYLGNKFPLEVVLDAKKLKGLKSKLTVSKGQQILFNQDFSIQNDDFSLTIPFFLSASESGVQRYKISLNAVSGEYTVLNNQQDIFIDVLDGRQKVLILADAPHPDVNAIRNSISSNDNYEISFSLAKDFNKFVKGYDLVILHQLPSLKNPILKITQELDKENVSRLFILGNQSSINQFNALKTGLTINGFSNRFNDCQAIAINDFSLFTLQESNLKFIKKYPPLSVPFGNFKLDNSVYPLLKQKVGMVETADPLIVFNTAFESKIAVIAGEGIWRWRLFDFVENQNQNNFDELIGKMVQFLALKVDKSFFKVISKNNFNENESIEFDAELYNESYELINKYDVNIVLYDKDKHKYPFVFNKTATAYKLNAGILPIGNYSYQASVNVGNKVLKDNGELSINALKVENLNTVADHQLLYSLAKKYGGESVSKNEFDKLLSILENREDIKPVSFSQQRLNEVINFKSLFFFILALLTLEWFVRRRSGAY